MGRGLTGQEGLYRTGTDFGFGLCESEEESGGHTQQKNGYGHTQQSNPTQAPASNFSCIWESNLIHSQPSTGGQPGKHTYASKQAKAAREKKRAAGVRGIAWGLRTLAELLAERDTTIGQLRALLLVASSACTVNTASRCSLPAVSMRARI